MESGVHGIEEPGSSDGLWNFAGKVKAIATNVKRITNLQLKVPGMHTCGCSHSPRMPAWKCLADPVPEHFPPLVVLDLYVPFCTPTPGFFREAHWVSHIPYAQET
jgi:hypothetical protein